MAAMLLLVVLLCGQVLRSTSSTQCEPQRSSNVRFTVSSSRNQTGHRQVAVNMLSSVTQDELMSVSVDQWTETCDDSRAVGLNVVTISLESTLDASSSNAITPAPTRSVDHNVVTTSLESTTSTSTSVPTTTALTRGTPPAGYQNIAGLGHYKFKNSIVTWDAARDSCEADGAHLVVFDTQEEFLQVYTKLSGGSCCPWVGIIRNGSSGAWVTVTGKPLDLFNFKMWGTGEPRNDGNCAIYNKHKSGLDDYLCTDYHLILCEFETINVAG